MNRIEFMTELASLLQDISVEERTSAMQYYNDYFDDAGAEKEQKIIEELGSPARVAAEVKEGLKIQEEETGEYRETGYADPRFEQKDSPAYPYDSKDAGTDSYGARDGQQEPPRTSKLLKWILIILIAIVACPVVIPVALGILCCILGVVIAAAALVAAAVIGAVALVVTGIVLFGSGIATTFTEAALGLTLMGGGLIVAVIGVILTVLAVKLCMVAVPGIFRGIVWLCRKPFQHGKAVA